MSRRRGVLLFGGAFIVLLATLVGGGYFLLRPQESESAQAQGFCRQCAALSRFERSLSVALLRDESFGVVIGGEDRARIRSEINGWQRRCSTLLCSRRAAKEEACAPPAASLLTELASIDALSEALTRRTALCAEGGCQSAKCEQARGAERAFVSLGQQLRALSEDPSVLTGDRRQISTGFVFDRLESLDESVLAAPGFVARGQFALAEARLLQLRDEALSAEASSPGSAEGLLADRIEEVNTSIEALAQGRRVGATGAGLVSLWRDFAEASSRLLVEAATLRTEMRGQGGIFEAMVHPERLTPANGQGQACDGTRRLVQSTEDKLEKAMGQLSLCNRRADCVGDEEEGVTSLTENIPPMDGRLMLEALANGRESASGALRALTFQKDAEVTLTTDLQTYTIGEAISVRPLTENNRCLYDRGSRVALMRSPSEDAEAALEVHNLDSSDSAVWLFEAPLEPGTYRFLLETSKSRGVGQFGASSTFAVMAPQSVGCTGFSGRWQTDFGTLLLQVRDGIARGSYRKSNGERAGLLVGTVEGSVLTGRWTSELGDGGARLTLRPDGRGFTGTWSQYPDRLAGAGKWEGQCVGGALLPVEPAPAGQRLPARQG